MKNKQWIFLIPLILLTISCGGSGSGNTESRSNIEDLLTFTGAFRLTNGRFVGPNEVDDGNPDSYTVNYAVGTLAYNPENHSLFIVGFSQQDPIAEYPIVDSSMESEIANLSETGEPLQGFTTIFDLDGNPEGINRITGMLWFNGALIVNAENWYDANGQNTDTTIVIADANNLAGDKEGYFKLSCSANCAGYMGPIPSEWQNAFGAEYFTGWSSVWSIVSRYSVGPSLWTFDPIDVVFGNATVSPEILVTAFMNYGYPDSMGDFSWAPQGEPGPFTPANPIWNSLSKGRYGFFIKGTRTFAVIGSSAGLKSGIGYKAVQSNGNVCGGPCPYDPDDNYNYYWLFDIQDILDAATNNLMPQPYDYGIWRIPFDNGGNYKIIGATLDSENNVLYVALGGAGKLGPYDYPPLILTYSLP